MDYILIFAVAAAIGIAARAVLRARKKNGCGCGCSGSCVSCPAANKGCGGDRMPADEAAKKDVMQHVGQKDGGRQHDDDAACDRKCG